jgi:hypothetical protein
MPPPPTGCTVRMVASAPTRSASMDRPGRPIRPARKLVVSSAKWSRICRSRGRQDRRSYGNHGRRAMRLLRHSSGPSGRCTALRKAPKDKGVTQGASLCCEVPRGSARHCKASGFRAFVASQARQRKRRQVRGPKKAPRELGGQGGARLGEYVNVPECSTRHQDDIAVGGLRHCETGARQRPLELAEHSQHPADGVEVSRHWRSRKRSTSRACSSPAQPDRSMTPCGHDVELAPSDTLQQRIQSRPLIAPLVPLMLSSR